MFHMFNPLRKEYNNTFLSNKQIKCTIYWTAIYGIILNSEGTEC